MSLFLTCRSPKDFAFVTVMYYKLWKLKRAYNKMIAGFVNEV